MKMKWQLILITVLLMVTLATALEECKDIQESNGIPCLITATWNYTVPCSTHTARVFNSTGNNTINYTFQTSGESPLCVFNWNVTTKGSYTYIIDTGDTGNITVSEDESMQIAIAIVLSTFAVLFMAVGVLLYLKFKEKE